MLLWLNLILYLYHRQNRLQNLEVYERLNFFDCRYLHSTSAEIWRSETMRSSSRSGDRTKVPSAHFPACPCCVRWWRRQNVCFSCGNNWNRLRGLNSSPPGEYLYLITDFEIKKKLITARKRSYGKVMFLHLSVILFTDVLYREWVSVQRDLCPGGGVSVQEGVSVWLGSLSGGLCKGDPHMIKSRWYASYWNAFLFYVVFFCWTTN